MLHPVLIRCPLFLVCSLALLLSIGTGAQAIPIEVSWSGTATNIEGESFSLSGVLGVFDTNDAGPFNLNGQGLLASAIGPAVNLSLSQTGTGPTQQIGFAFTDTNPASLAGNLVNTNGISVQLVFGNAASGFVNFLLVGPIANPTAETLYQGGTGSGSCGEGGINATCRGGFALQFSELIVPEPSTGLLLATALAGLGYSRRHARSHR